MRKKSWFEIKALGDNAEVFIYEEIGIWGITAKDFIDELSALSNIKTISLRINSPGGSVFEGNAIYNAIKRHTAHVTAHIDGIALSMASVIAMAADEVVMAENSLIMIHNPVGGVYGSSADMRSSADLIDKIKITVVNAYAKRTGISVEEISNLMDSETWFDADEAEEFGFSDRTDEEIEMAASFDLDKYKFQNTPTNYKSSLKKETLKPSAKVVTKKEAIMPRKENAADEAVNEKDIINKGIEQEQKRSVDIRARFTQFPDYRDLMDKCLSDINCSADEAGVKLLDVLGKATKPASKDLDMQVGEETQEKFFNAALDAIHVRSGMKKAEKNDNEFRGHSLLDLARHSLQISGKNIRGLNKMDIVGAAITHSGGDFTKLLANTAEKSLLVGYEEAPETYQIWTKPGNLSDFKVADRSGLSLFSDMDVIASGSEYKFGTFNDIREQIQLLTYGKKFSISRQTIINDDLGAFTEIPRKMGRAARRKVGDLAYGVLTANANMSDGVALFHANHANLAGSAAAISTASVDAARSAMGIQTDPSGNGNLNIRPTYFLVPISKDGVASVTMSNEFEIKGNANDPQTANSVRNLATVVSDARLDAASATAWYLLGSQMANDTVEVAFLDGNDQPYLEEQMGWDVDGIEYKVRIDCAAKAIDFRAMYKNAGA